ncbi:hypothetical protein G9A89_016343 [Geosiphon pyriformis]|nr:hypothetical protein G9A89_016343 [Geosiphon pyriformis]
MHPADLQAAVINARDFEAAELKANHAQAINLVINGSFELDSKLKQFSNSINQKLEEYLANNQAIYQPPQQCNNQGNTNCFQNQSHLLFLTNQQWQQKTRVCYYCAIIFPFELEEPSVTPLFSGATLEEKPITVMYMDAKVDDQSIKLILDTNGATKTPIGEINNLLIEINGIIMPIKVLVIKATQYQAFIGNNWLSKTNAVLNWMTQKLTFNQNGQHMRVPATCDHFKTTNPTTPLIEFEEEKKKLIWEAYQVSWTDKDHNKLLPILLWNDQGKEKQKKTKLT